MAADVDQLVIFRPGASGRAVSVPQNRIAWLDAAKGVGIILVVAFHAIGGFFQAGLLSKGGLFEAAYDIVYTFHMPFFFFLSGLLLEERLRKSGLSALLRSSVSKLLYPCFLWGYIQLGVIYSLGTLVNAPLKLEWIDLISPLWAPPSQFWFLYVLFVLQAIAAVTLTFSNRIMLVPIGLLFRVVIPSLVSTGVALSVGLFAPFYMGGVLAGPNARNLPDLIKYPALLSLVLIPITLTLGYLNFRYGDWYWGAYALPAAVVGTIALLAFSAIPEISSNAILNLLGRRALTIFLAHVLFVAGTRIFFTKLLHFDGAVVVLPLAILAGLVGPLLLYRVADRLKLVGVLGLS